MEGRRVLDLAGGAVGVKGRWLAVLLVALWLAAAARAQNNPPSQQIESEARRLADQKRWSEVAALLAPVNPRTAEMDYDYGSALARLDRWSDAGRAFEAGRQLAPHDARFLVELAGVAFEQKQYARAAALMRRALRLKPDDAYADDFLGTVYFIEGNLPASLKYWNRLGKPRIDSIDESPRPEVSAALLDHAFAFAPASTLRLRQFYDTRARLDGLGIFPEYQLDLTALKNGDFNVRMRGEELDGFGHTRLESLYRLFRGLPFQSLDPEAYNLHRHAINFVSMLRWDAQKRRIFAQFSGPFEDSAKVRYQVDADLRNEQWVIRNGFAGYAPPLASLNLVNERVDFQLVSHAGGEFFWMGGAEFSHRRYRTVDAGAVLTPQMLAEGYQLRQQAKAGAVLWRVPERRFAVRGEVESEAARLWSTPAESSESLRGGIDSNWYPQAKGDDYRMQQSFRAGRTFGQVPFDDLFILGLERDNDLPMRAHIGTRDGRKGSAPLGRDYELASWEADKNLYGNGIVAVKLGPFVDTGQITDPGTGLGSHKWLTDVGAQVKLRVFGSGVVFSYGKDLRSGNNAFYLTILKKQEDGE